MGKTFKKNSEDYKKKSAYENRNKKSDYFDSNLIENNQFDINERQNTYDLYNDTRRRKQFQSSPWL